MRRWFSLCLSWVVHACTVARARLSGSDHWGTVVLPTVPPLDALKLGELGSGTFHSLGSKWSSTKTFISEGGLAAARVACSKDRLDEGVPLSSVELLPPLTDDGQRMMLGLNYRQHAREAGVPDAEAEEFIMMFPKLSLPTSHVHPVLRPPHVKFLDYEVEMGVVLAKTLHNALVTDENVHEYVAGIVLVHDFTARAEQLHQQQWVKGKGYRSFGPIGPFLYLLEPSTASLTLRSLQLRLWVNGELRQDASTVDMIHHVPRVLTELSHTFDYGAGDAIWTGTPSGVIVGRSATGAPSSTPPLLRAIGQMIFRDSLYRFLFADGGMMAKKPWLKPGDVVTATAFANHSGVYLGTTRNVVSEDKSWLYQEKNLQETGFPWHVPAFSCFVFAVCFSAGILMGCLCRKRGSKQKQP